MSLTTNSINNSGSIAGVADAIKTGIARTQTVIDGDKVYKSQIDDNGNVIGPTSVTPNNATPKPSKSYIGRVNTTNNSNLITRKTDEQRNLIRQAIATSLEQSKLANNNNITNINDQASVAMRGAENQYYGAVPALQERLANLGASAGGAQSRSENLGLETNRINTETDINSSAAKLINDANMNYDKLVSEGKVQEATQLAQLAGQELSQLLSESGRLDAFKLQKAGMLSTEDMANKNYALETDRFGLQKDQFTEQKDQFGKTFGLDTDKFKEEKIQNAFVKAQTMAQLDGYMRNTDGTYLTMNGLPDGDKVPTLAKANFDKEMTYKEGRDKISDALSAAQYSGVISPETANILGIPHIPSADGNMYTADYKIKIDTLAEQIRNNKEDEDFNERSLNASIANNKEQNAIGWYNAKKTALPKAPTATQQYKDITNKATSVVGDWVKQAIDISGNSYQSSGNPVDVAKGKLENPEATAYMYSFMVNQGISSNDAMGYINELKKYYGVG